MTLVILSSFLTLSLLTKNTIVSIALAVLLVTNLAGGGELLPLAEKFGVQAGILLLTIAVLSPIAAGRIGKDQLAEIFVTPSALLAVAVGIFVSYLGARGVSFMSGNPLVVSGLLIGTMIGVALCRGVPVGPLIAAGMTAMLLDVQKLWG